MFDEDFVRIEKIFVSKVVLAGGAVKISEEAFELIAQNTNTVIEQTLRLACTYTDYVKSKTVTPKILKYCLNYNCEVKCGIHSTVCKYPGKRNNKSSNRREQGLFYWENSHELFIDSYAFMFLVKQIAKNGDYDIAFTRDAVVILQHYIQNTMMNVVRCAMKCVDVDGILTILHLRAVENLTFQPLVHTPRVDTEMRADIRFAILHIAKQCFSNFIITRDAVEQIVYFASRFINIITHQACFLISEFAFDAKIIESQDVKTAASQCFPMEINRHANNTGIRALKNFKLNFGKHYSDANIIFRDILDRDSGEKITKEDRTGRAHLTLNVGSVFDHMKDISQMGVSDEAAVYMTAIIEYIIVEIINISGQKVSDRNGYLNCIGICEINNGINSDDELCEMFRMNCTGMFNGRFHFESLSRPLRYYHDVKMNQDESRMRYECPLYIDKYDDLQEEFIDRIVAEISSEDFIFEDVEDEYRIPIGETESIVDAFMKQLELYEKEMYSEIMEKYESKIKAQEEDEEEEDDEEDEEEDEEEEDEEISTSEIDPRIVAFINSQIEKLRSEIVSLKR